MENRQLSTETINISSEEDSKVLLMKTGHLRRRRSSLFRPKEDCATDIDYPEVYKEKLEDEKKKWTENFNLAKREYKDAMRYKKQSRDMKLDRTILDNWQVELLDKGHINEQYLKAVRDFSNKLDICSIVHAANKKRRQVEKDHLLSQSNYVCKMLVDKLQNMYSVPEE